MTRSSLFLPTVLLLLVTLLTSAQSYNAVDFIYINEPAPFSNRAAVMIDGNVCDASYFTPGSARLSPGIEGTFTIASFKESGGCASPKNNISFHVAIKNDRNHTMWMYTSDPVKEVDVEELTKQCQNGDSVMFIPVDKAYELRNHSMRVAAGC